MGRKKKAAKALTLPAYREEEDYLPAHPRKKFKARNKAQTLCLRTIEDNEIALLSGSPGTGKTYLAVAAAVEALDEGIIDRIVLIRPAMEAGESIGFLPGTLQEKVLPFLRPLYDSLHDIVGKVQTEKWEENGKIEVTSLGYSRGRTFSKCFVICDEAQNASYEQVIMLLTRIGFESRMIICGDLSQSDLDDRYQGGFLNAMNRLEGVKGIGVFQFLDKDVVRNPIIKEILARYKD